MGSNPTLSAMIIFSRGKKNLKKIVFIEPSPPDVHVFSRFGLPRLGVILLGTILKQAGYDVKVYVEDLEKIDFEDAVKADMVGISTITSTAPRSYVIADQLRSRGVPVMMGGPHVTFMAEEALEHCDFVLRGEAEESILPFLDALERGSGIEQVPGLSFKVGDSFFHNPDSARCMELDTLPFPDFDLLYGNIKHVRPMLTSRGCPHNCTFCAVTDIFGRKYRFRSIDNIMEELRTVPKGELVFFYDDNFAADRKHTKELLQRMIDEGIRPQWTAQVRADCTKDIELLELMNESNCYYVYIGMESINPETLKEYRKDITLKEIEKSVRRLHAYDVRVHGMFVMGADSDTTETIDSTVKFATQNRIDTVQFMILIPIPGTEYYKQMKAEDRILNEDWSFYDGHHVVHRPMQMSALELQMGMFHAMRRFYSIREILKVFFRFDFMAFLYKSYARRTLRKWWKGNRYYVDRVRQLGHDAGIRLEGLRRTADDIIERFRNITHRESETETKSGS